MQRARLSWRSITAHPLAAFVVFTALCCLPLLRSSSAQSQSGAQAQSQALPEASATTEYNVFARSWWPTSGTAPASAYAGSKACQQCHAEEVASQATTPMAHASYHSAVAAWGAEPLPVTLRLGDFAYHVVPQGADPKLIVESGSQSNSGDIIWTFGAGVVGQTFVLESKGNLYDAEITSFHGLQGGMDISPAHKPPKASDLDRALGEKMTPKSGPRCFGCHTTTSTTKDHFDPEHAIPGIGCEGCHGPGLTHVVAANLNLIRDAAKLIFNPRSLSPVESVDFCGSCHMTSADVVESRLFVPSNVRFPPYRLEKSRCWGVRGDLRLACYACHDPHKPLVQEASSYDQRCLSCHSAGAARPSDRADSAPEICPKATANCTDCHMPKYDVPEMHGKFTDHFIRVVRPGERYPVQ